MRLRDKIWIAFFSLAGMIFILGTAYEFLYLDMAYKREEGQRMDRVYDSYVRELEGYLEESSIEFQDKYIVDGRPQARALSRQDKYIAVSGKAGRWTAKGEELETPGRTGRGFIVEGNRILGYIQGVDGEVGIFKVDKEDIPEIEGYRYYTIEMEPYLFSKIKAGEVEGQDNSVEKRYYLPAEKGHLMIKIKREGVMFYRIIKGGRRYVLWGTMGLALIIFIAGRVFEKSVTYPIKRASQKLDNILIKGEFKERIALGSAEEMKGLEKNINDILRMARRKKEKYRLLYEDIPIVTAILDRDLNLVEVNEYFVKKIKKGDPSVGESILNFIPADKVNLFTSLYRKLEEEHEIEGERITFMDSDFNGIPVNLSMKRIVLEDKSENIFLTALEVSRVDVRNKEGRDILKEDKELGIYSRGYGSYYIEKYINMCRVSNFVFTVMLLWREEENHMTSVNREEEVIKLRKMGEKIKNAVRGTDLVYRFDRNTFALLLPMMKESEVNQLKERIGHIVEGRDYEEEKSRLRFISERYNGKYTSLELEDYLYLRLKEHRGKEPGRINENHLLTGMEREELKVIYTPVADTEGKVRSLEAALEWRNPRGIKLNHEDIYTLAVEGQILNEVGRYLLERVERDIERGGIPISIRVSGEELEEGNILGVIKRIFYAKDTRGLLEVEVSGEDFRERREKIYHTLRELKSMGIGLTLSDVGRGNVSLEDIGGFNFDKLKLSEDLCRELEGSQRKKNLVSSIVGAARAGNRGVIASEIERREEADLLRDLGCTMFYGRLVGEKGEYSEVMGEEVS